ncbi:MAG: hypothetical protein ACRDT9_16190, partial [Agromyces sp.]
MTDERADPTTSTTPDPALPAVAAVPLESPGEATRVPWAAVVVFAVVSCGLAWVVAAPLWMRGLGMTDPLLPVIAAAMM